MTKINDIKSKYEYASLNRKIIAFGIDVVIITLVLSPIMNLLMMIFFGFDTNYMIDIDKNLDQTKIMTFSSVMSSFCSTISNLRYIMVQLILLMLAMAYFVFFWYKMGASIGKLIMRCKIVDADSYNDITMRQAIKRMAGHLFNLITLGMGLFMADFTKKKQGLHDKFANTVVVIKRKKES
jgi:uncharacterized RDD family membrane protein YckC